MRTEHETSEIEAALALLTEPPWARPADRGRRLAALPVEPALSEEWLAKAMVLRHRGSVEEDLLLSILRSPEAAARGLLGACAGPDRRVAWLGLRHFALRVDGLPIILATARALGAIEAVEAARLDDPRLCHPLEPAQLAPQAELPPPSLRADLDHPSAGTVLSREQTRRLVELFAMSPIYWPYPHANVLREALTAGSREALGVALPALARGRTRRGILIAALRLGGDAVRPSEQDVETPVWVYARAAASDIELCRMATHKPRRTQRLARARIDTLLAASITLEPAEDEHHSVSRALRAALERAMVGRRRWSAPSLLRIADHAVLGPMLRALVLGRYDAGDRLEHAFYLDAERPTGTIGIAHPVELSGRAALRRGEQPFAQLTRAVHGLEAHELSQQELARFAQPFDTGRLFGLVDRGWRRVSDIQFVRGFARSCANGLEVAVELGGLHWKDLNDTPLSEGQVNRIIVGRPESRDRYGYLRDRVPWGELHPIDFSEVARDLAKCVALPTDRPPLRARGMRALERAATPVPPVSGALTQVSAPDGVVLIAPEAAFELDPRWLSELLVGHSPECHLCVHGMRLYGVRNARLFHRDDAWWVQTFHAGLGALAINDARAGSEPVRLNDGDVLKFTNSSGGPPLVLRFHCPGGASSP